MDHDATLRALITAALRLRANELDSNAHTDEAEFMADVETMADGFLSLHDWIMNGGFLPTNWQSARKGR